MGCDGGFVEGLVGREDGVGTVTDADVTGRGKAAGEVMVATAVLGAPLWAALSGETVTEEAAAGSGGGEAVFTTATAAEAPPPVKTNTEVRIKNSPLCILIHVRFSAGNWSTCRVQADRG